MSSNLNAQFGIGTEWTYNDNDFGYLTPEVVSIEKDTIIDNQTWFVLEGISGCASSFSSSAIREEGKKVFLRDLPTGEETLLYDFDLDVGDSYEVLIFRESSFFYTVNIDSVGVTEFNGKERKVQYVDNPDFGSVFIEGIGSTHYLVPQGNICDPQYFGIRCFSTPDEFIDFDLDRECDARYFYNQSSTNEYKLSKEITLYPNPLYSDVLYIENSSDLSIENIEIYDLQGRNLKAISSSFDKIELNGLQPGNYFLKIIAGKNVALKRFLVF